MNPCKIPNSNLVLCRSKRFPHKVYYFNVSTGEAVWFYSDTEKADQKSQVKDVKHTYPEPKSPTDKSPPPRQFPFTPYNGKMNQSSYLPTNPSLNNNMAVSMYVQPFDNTYMRSVMPYQFPSPMFWPPPMFMPFGPNTNMMPWPVAPQTQLVEEKPASQDIMIDTSKKPMKKCFINYQDPVIKFKDDKIVDPQMYNSNNSNNSIHSNNPEFDSPKKSPDSETFSQGAKVSSESDLHLTSGLYKLDKMNNNLPNKDRNNNIADKSLSGSSGPCTHFNESFTLQQTSPETLIQSRKKLFEPTHKIKHNKQTQTNKHNFMESPKFGKTLLNVNQLKGTSDKNQDCSYQNTRGQNCVGPSEQNFISQSEQNFVDQSKQNFVGQSEQNVVNQSEQNLVGQSEENFFGRSEQNSVGQSGQNFVGQSGRNFVGHSEQNFVGRSEQNFVGRSEQKFVGPRGQNLFVQREHNFVGQNEQNIVGQNGRNFVGQSEQNFVGRSKQKFVGQRGQNLFGQSEKNSVGQNKQNFAVQSEENFVGQSEQNVVNQSEQNLVGQSEENFFGQSEQNSVGQSGQNFVGQSGQNFVGHSEQNFVGQSEQNFVGRSEQNCVVPRGQNLYGKREQNFVGQNEQNVVSQNGRNFVSQNVRNFVGQSEQNFVGQSEQKFVGQHGQNLFGQSEQNFVGQNEQNVVGQNGRNFVGQSEQNFVGRSEQNFVGQREQNFVGQNEQNVVGQNGRNFVGQNERNFVGQSGQNLVSDSEYGQSHTRIFFSGKNELKTEHFQESSGKQENYDQSLKITGILGYKQNNPELTKQIGSNGLMFQQNQMKSKCLDDQIQTDQNHLEDDFQDCFVQTQDGQKVLNKDRTCFKNLQTDYELNLLQQCAKEKSALKQRTKDKFSVKSVLDEALYFEDRNGENNSPIKEKNTVENVTQEEIFHLGENDLRRVLLAKKSKIADLTTTLTTKSTKIKTTRQVNTAISAPKKKVTFNPVLDIFSDASAENSANAADVEYEEASPSKCWYAVADTMTLLEEYEFIEQFVQSDPYCALVIPHRVMSETVALSRRQCPESRLVTRARHLLRTLDTRPAHVMLQATGDKSPSASSVISILHCCLDIMENAGVVLITNDEYLRKKAENIGVECFITEDIKLSFTNTPLFGRNCESECTNMNVGREADQTRDATNVSKLNTPLTNNDLLKCNENNTNFKNNAIPRKPIDLENRSVTLQKNKKDEEISIFKRANIKVSNQPISKTCMFKNDKSRSQGTKHSIFGNVFESNNGNSETNSMYGNNKLTRNQAHESILEKEGNKQRSLQSPVLDSANKDTQQKEISFDKSNTADDKIDLEEFVKRFSMKNMDLELLAEQIKDEIICSFRQIMEEFSMEVLKDHKNLLETHGMLPPFSLKEAIHCLGLVYGEHASVRETTDVLSRVLDSKGEVPRSEALRSCACAMALVQCFKNVAGAAEPAEELRRRLETVLGAARCAPAELPHRAAAPPAAALEPVARKNFAKDRSEVLQYLKKHFPAWADYDETSLENNPTPSWGKTYKDAMVVRIFGKNLNKLTLNNCKPMSINEPDPSTTCDGIATSSPKEPKEYNTLKIINMTRSMDPRIYTKQNTKLSTIVENPTIEKQKPKQNEDTMKQDQNVDENQNIKEKKPEPKVVRLFNNYLCNFNKDTKEVNLPKQTLRDNFETYGHTFSTEEGPKILRHIRPIKEFEEKLKHRPLDVDEFDCSTISLTGYDHFVKQINNSRLDNNSDTQENAFGPTKLNDNLDLTNDTNNKSFSMSLEHSPTNNCIFDSTNHIISEIGDSKNDRTNLTIEHLDYMSFDTSGFDEFFGITDDFKMPNCGDNCKGNDQKNYVYEHKNDLFGHKDDILVSKDDKSPGSENIHENSYLLVNSFPFELKVSFDAIYKCIRSIVMLLRGGTDTVQRDKLHAHARDIQRRLYGVVSILDRIVYRESVSGPRVKDMFKGTLYEDDRLQHYRHIVTECVEQVLHLNEALKMLQQLTAPAERESCHAQR